MRTGLSLPASPADSEHLPMNSTAGENLFRNLISDKLPELADRPAIQSDTAVLTYGDLSQLVKATAQLLRAAGARPGDRIGLNLGNSPEYIVAFLAVADSGCLAVPFDANAGAGRIRYIEKKTRPGFSLCSAKGGLSEKSAIPQITYSIDVVSKRAVFSPGPEPAPVVPDSLFCSAGSGGTPAAILFSAGSTGQPKGVVLKQGHFLNIAQTLAAIIGMDRDHRELILSPMTHSGGWQRVTSTLLSGGCIILPQGFLTVTAILEDILRFGVTGFFTTPPLIRSLLKASPEKISKMAGSCRSIEIASAPLSPDELDHLLSLFPGANVFFQYGLTECSRALILDSRENMDKLHTVGKPTNGVEVAISGPGGKMLEANLEGEILLRADKRMGAYWEDPERNEARIQNGWFRTGDFGFIDEDGFIAYRGRRDDMINCGGYSYFPAEVENELGRPEGVKEYLIAGVSDPQKVLTHVSWAFVVPEDPETWSVKNFLAAARKKLPPQMVPRRVVVLSAIPHTSTGKPNRRLTVQRYGPDAELNHPGR